MIERNPDVIIVTSHAAPGKSAEELIVYIEGISGWRDLRAVKEEKIYVFTDSAEDILVRPDPRITIAVKLLASVLHPGLLNASLPNVIRIESSNTG